MPKLRVELSSAAMFHQVEQTSPPSSLQGKKPAKVSGNDAVRVLGRRPTSGLGNITPPCRDVSIDYDENQEQIEFHAVARIDHIILLLSQQPGQDTDGCGMPYFAFYEDTAEMITLWFEFSNRS